MPKRNNLVAFIVMLMVALLCAKIPVQAQRIDGKLIDGIVDKIDLLTTRIAKLNDKLGDYTKADSLKIEIDGFIIFLTRRRNKNKELNILIDDCQKKNQAILEDIGSLLNPKLVNPLRITTYQKSLMIYTSHLLTLKQILTFYKLINSLPNATLVKKISVDIKRIDSLLLYRLPDTVKRKHDTVTLRLIFSNFVKRVEERSDSIWAEVFLPQLERIVKTETERIEKKMDDCCTQKAIATPSFFRHQAMANGFQNNLFSIGYAYCFSGGANAFLLGSEFVFPVQSNTTNKVGGFINLGFAQDKIQVELGLGGLETSTNNQSISWKFKTVYSPGRIGIGIGYSPILGCGGTLVFKWH